MFADPVWRVCRRKLSFFRSHPAAPHICPQVAAPTGCRLVEGLVLHVEVCLCSSHKTIVGSQICSTRGFFQMVVSDSVLYHQMVISDSAIVLPDGGVWLCFVSSDRGIWQCPCVTRWWYLLLCHQLVLLSHQMMVSDSVIVSPDGGVWQCHCVTRWWCLKLSLCHHEDVIWQCHCVTRWWCLCYCVIIWGRTVWLCHQLGVSDSVIVSTNGVTVSSDGVWWCHCVIRWCLMASLCHKMM